MAPSDNYFTQVPFLNFCKKMQKMKIDYVYCPMRKFWRTSLRPFGQNNVGISNEMPGEGCTSNDCLNVPIPAVKLKLHNCFAYFNQKINPWRMVFYFFILLLRLLSY